jgi:selenide,water dikinase
MLEVGVAAATDVTGFGLLGHLLPMLDRGVSAELRWSAIPMLAEAVELARAGVLPGGSKRNIETLSPMVDTTALDDAEAAVLFDAQTSGGLLVAVTENRTQSLLESLSRRRVPTAAAIGKLVTGNGTVTVTR